MNEESLEKCLPKYLEEKILYNIPIDVDTIEKGYPILCA